MRNPFRLKNLNGRFLPAAGLAVGLVVCAEPSAWSIAIGAPVVLLGSALRVWAVGHLVKTERFTVTGPYAHCRHPLYLGTLCIASGTALMLGGWAAVAGGVCVATWFSWSYLPRKERVEGDRLLARYGDAYARYRREVPALRPRLAPWRPGEGDASSGDPRGAWQLARFDANNELGALIAVSCAVALVGLRAAIG